MDTLGLVLAVVVHAADIQDRDGAKLVLEQIRTQRPRLKCVWADAGYAGEFVEWVKTTCGWIVDVVRKRVEAVGFEVLPKRWIVERTFAWIGKYRRHSKDYETLTDSSEAHLKIAMTPLMLRRITRHQLRWRLH